MRQIAAKRAYISNSLFMKHNCGLMNKYLYTLIVRHILLLKTNWDVPFAGIWDNFPYFSLISQCFYTFLLTWSVYNTRFACICYNFPYFSLISQCFYTFLLTWSVYNTRFACICYNFPYFSLLS